MRNVYRVLGYLIAAGVVVQTALIAYGVFAMNAWINGGNALDKNAWESGSYSGGGGFNLHGAFALAIGVLVLLLLVVSFFTKVKGATVWALITLGVYILQFLLAILSFDASGIGVLHGINAFVLAGVASVAAGRVSRAARQPVEAQTSSSVPAV